MERFVAMIWNGRGRQPPTIGEWTATLQRSSPKWQIVLDAPGLRVLSRVHRGLNPIIARWLGRDGVIVGPLFLTGCEDRGRVHALTARDIDPIASTRGDALIRNYWGNYLAFWREPEGGRTFVIRDPCGAVPCFTTQKNGVHLLFAHAGDIAPLRGLQFTPNWKYLRAFLANNYIPTTQTGLCEISELLPGQRWAWGGDEPPTLSWAWNGAEHAASPSKRDFDEARRALRAVSEQCLGAWGNEYGNVVVRLSGGLDSSVLLGLLRTYSRARLTAFHHVGTGYDQTELKQARLAATAAGIELLEVRLDASAEDLRPILDCPPLARPTRQILALQSNQTLAAINHELGASCTVAGHGGDNLFLQRSIASHTLTDYLRLNGIDGQFPRLAYEASTLQGRPLSVVLRSAFETLHGGIKRNSPAPEPGSPLRHGLFAEAVEEGLSASDLVHPWLASPSRLPPGKIEHLRHTLALYNYYAVRGDALERDLLYPFFSQPIAELALRTPTYLLAAGGTDRTLERSAFADLVPEAILRRTNKGFVDSYLLTVARRNIRFMRDLVLNGTLIRQGWLSRDKTERALTREGVLHGGAANFIFSIVVVEAWLASWRSTDVLAAA